MTIIDSYLKTGFRNLIKYKFYSIINILGLAIGIAGSLMITLYVLNEFNYDRFNNDYDRIYRIARKAKIKGDPIRSALTCAPMANAIMNECPEIESVTRLSRMGDWLIGSGDRKFNEEQVLFADSSLFGMFSFKLIKGDPKKVLSRPRTMVMTQTAVKKYFGSEDPFGKSIRVGQDTTLYEITGIMEDVPPNSHFHFLILCSINSYPLRSENQVWTVNEFYSYVKLRKGASPEMFEQKLHHFAAKYIGPRVQMFLKITFDAFEKSGSYYGYFIQPLKGIHLTSNLTDEFESNGDSLYVYILSVAAVLILLIACINFMNLATARSATRAKEVGLRKVVGSDAKRLVIQFLSESILVSFIALAIALLIVELLLPSFNNLLGIKLSMGYLSKWYIIPSLISFSVLVGLISGFYPSLFLASFKPISVLKGRVKAGAKSGLLRSILVISQFTVCIVILLATTVIFKQLRFMQSYNLGFSKENKLVVKRSDGLKKNIDAFKAEALKIPGVVSIANSDVIPGSNFSLTGFNLEGDENTETLYICPRGYISFGYEKTLGLQLVEGRFLNPDIATDSSAIVISQATAKVLGLENPLQRRLISSRGDNSVKYYWRIVGVVKDFHIASLKASISPITLTIMPGNWEGVVIADIQPDNVQNAINGLRAIWEKMSEYPFEYYFLDDSLANMYKGERRTGIILISFSILAIIISCLGLLGMVSFTTSLRTKEIAIRKTLGAEEKSIISVLSSETLRLIVFSTIIAWVISWFALNKWLQNFAYHTKINPYLFVAVPAIITIISFVTISFEVIKATRRNPADVLRYE
ncbi:MAG: FtsX-like permease family protein [Bacteroidales bacterium]|nr:FtsX-like permease family protein [Bacteroidales bacterium]